MASEKLLQRMRAARERVVTLAPDRSVTVRRPTDLELTTYARGGGMDTTTVFDHVVDWSGFTEADLVPSGASDAVPFDRELFAEWVADHPQHWPTIAAAITDMIEARKQAREDGTKN